jgi:hypothetical protein
MKNFSKTIFAAAAMTLALAAQAATVEVTSNTAVNIEEFNGDLAIAKFDASLGTLTSVKFELFSNLYGNVFVSNDGPGVDTFKVIAGGQVDGDVLGTLLNVSGSSTQTFADLPAGDSGFVNLTPWTVSNSLTLSSASALAAFTGTGGTYHAALTGWSTADTVGSGNATYTPYVFMDGYAKVTYTYEVAPVPEPETYAMMLAGLALVGGIARRRKSA